MRGYAVPHFVPKHPFVARMRQFFLRPVRAPLVLVAIGIALAGCASQGDGPSPTEQRIVTAVLFGGRALPAPPETVREFGCPSATLLDGTGVYRSGDSGTARGVSYQAWINDIARECMPQGNLMRIKVGIQGRFILGENGKPGTYTVPIRVAVRRGEETVLSRLLSASVSVPASDTQSPFVLVDDSITVTIGADDPGDEYKILIGIDPQGQRAAPRKRRR